MVSWVSPWCWAIWLLFEGLPLGQHSACLLLCCALEVVLSDVAMIISCGNNCAACILFSLIARKEVPPWQRLREMHAFRDQDGNILVLCIHFRAQSGDSGYMARESCRQGPLFASSGPKSCMARRCCQRRPPRQPSPGAPAESSAHTRAPLPCRADSAAVPAIPVKWCGDTIAHTRKLRF